ncbi:HAD-IIIC family phosphatase [Shewanella frigidimarina]|uniref:HAD-superfamily phosphatase, subfamily IIIC n=1 Tax=Shewanella frigidimarina (strain NCIMB 400) TaxID=318167 RepID=Q07Z90_SHEFN|nr:HAD-IIIC family phosphatase [Shewanella frigidimarina]ABI72674.1 HAD-superfamily phosphatase, subfamily IIIC [Shewanella frigidimarina NCIMB 400]
MNTIKNNIKLVIWDLDETFWKGTFSEEGIVYQQAHHDLVIELTKRGIVNSICSKNNREEIQSFLTAKGLWDYFVFAEIGWDPKGKAVQSIIKDMALRAENVLFIDDNTGNINEVIFENPNISACEPDIIETLLSSKYLLGKDDNELSRLSQYKILESKREILKDRNLSNFDFLVESQIRVNVIDNIDDNIDRVLELIERTNQLNYTKNRVTKSELFLQLNSDNVSSGVINVIDKYGDYGISGFYLMKDNELIHFLFSCRTMNMGIENWLYKYLGCPKLNVIGDVASKVDESSDVAYITLNENKFSNQVVKRDGRSYLIVGGCDLDQVVHYLSGKNVDTLFNFVNNKNISVHGEHTTFLINELTEDELKELNSLDIYEGFKGNKKLYSNNWDVLIYSPLNDYSRGLYKSKLSNLLIPFDSFSIDWTDVNNFNKLPPHLIGASSTFFDFFKDNYTFKGAIKPTDFYDNLEKLISMFPNKHFMFLTGAEVNINHRVREWELDMHIRHREMNSMLEKLNDSYENVQLIDVRKFVSSETQLTDNIRHYIKPIYSEVAKEICSLSPNDTLKSSNKYYAVFKRFGLRIRNKLKLQVG